MLTDFMLMGNIMIVSAEIRRAPYADILLLSVRHPGRYDDHIFAVLTAVTERLGFHTLSRLCETYAPSIAMSFFAEQEDLTHLPPRLLGYRDRRESATTLFMQILPIGLLGMEEASDSHGRSQLAAFCVLMHSSTNQVLRELFAIRVALRICTEFDTPEDVSNQRSEIIWRALQTWATESASPGESPEVVFNSQTDVIVYHMLRSIGEIDPSPGGDLSEAIKSQFPSAEVSFSALTQFRGISDLSIHRPNAPLYTSSAVLQALRWLRHMVAQTSTFETLYHVLHRLFAAVEKSLLVNEQLRYLNGICILVSIQTAAFQEVPVLLRNLLFGAVSVLAQPDLSRRAQSIIEWACQIYSQASEADPRFPELLSRIARIAFDFTTHPDREIQVTGDKMLGWAEDLASRLYLIPHAKEQVLRALHLWPRPATGPLAKIASELSYGELLDILSGHELASNKFRLVRRLRDLIRHGVVTDNFPRHDFWHLKACIPSSTQLDDEDVDAFVETLYANAGRLRSAGETAISLHTIAVRHQGDFRGSKDHYKAIAPNRSILLSLVDMMYGDDGHKVYVAYQSLRLLMSLEENTTSWKDPPQEILLIAQTPLRPLESKAADINLLNSNEYVNGSQEFDTWIASITQVICDILSSQNQFYAQLCPILEDDVRFATELFPIVVHELLRRTEKHENNRNSSARIAISHLFTLVLQSNTAAGPSVRAIVDTVLHLRNIQRPSIKGEDPKKFDPLGSDSWLDVDLVLLAHAATRCGSYTTALLFLELRAPDPPDDPRTEQILYDIYSHIQEPDGFYGIKSHDVQDFLIRRFHHEKQWTKALQFHGADFEATAGARASRTPQISGVVQSLHSFGFDHLAVAINQALGTEITTTTSSMDYQLGWRTENWDLPNSDLNQHPGCSLFVALRAIHRERDSSSAEAIVQSALRHEILNLHSIGNENMTEVQDAVQRLLCLGEVRRWTRYPVQSAITSKEWPTGISERLELIPSGFEYALLFLHNVRSNYNFSDGIQVR
jgi:serine-protein kinase ATM